MAAAKLPSVLRLVEIYGVQAPTACYPGYTATLSNRVIMQFGKPGQLKRMAGSLRSRRLKITGVNKNRASKGPR